MTFAFTKYAHYFPAYEEQFAGIEVNRLLEIGVQKGGSLWHWRRTFPNALIRGIDIDPACRGAEDICKGIRVLTGDASSPKFLNRIARHYGPFDVIIDDGGHWPFMQRQAFKTLWPSLRTGGVYVIEDLQTAFNWRWLRGKGTFRMLNQIALDQTRKPTGVGKIAQYSGIVFIHKSSPFIPSVLEFGDVDCRGASCASNGSTFPMMVKDRLRRLILN